jgi:hypothetical protein
MARTTGIAVALGLLILVSTTCVSSSVKQGDEQAAATEGRHWVQDWRLRAIMADLDREISTSWPQEIEEEYAATHSAKAARAMEEACWLSEGLVKAATRIPDAVAEVEMPEEESRAFLAKAETLRRQAQDLQATACAADVEKMRRVLTSIRTTCHSCHDRFREVAGPIRTR